MRSLVYIGIVIVIIACTSTIVMVRNSDRTTIGTDSDVDLDSTDILVDIDILDRSKKINDTIKK